ncbi:uncharacterized protein [Struthio camelus]|uniref:uncharacterized protein isoform X2 n=1 Tax=Struthio camelus TaxID=8801 RepID=UPI003604162F
MCRAVPPGARPTGTRQPPPAKGQILISPELLWKKVKLCPICVLALPYHDKTTPEGGGSGGQELAPPDAQEQPRCRPILKAEQTEEETAEREKHSAEERGRESGCGHTQKGHCRLSSSLFQRLHWLHFLQRFTGKQSLQYARELQGLDKETSPAPNEA